LLIRINKEDKERIRNPYH